MLDLGWTEILVIGMLALIVVGPKELPGLLRTIGQYVGKARSMAREFQRSLDDAAREADISALKELRDAKRELDGMARVDFSEQAKRSSNSALGGGKPAETAPKPASAPVSAPPSEPAAKPVEPPRPTGSDDA